MSCEADPRRIPLYKRDNLARRREQERLTTGIGVRCPNAILLFTDTQDTSHDNYREFSPKIHFLKNDEFALACSGITEDITLFVAYLTNNFASDNKKYTEAELVERLHNLVVAFKKQRITDSGQSSENPRKVCYDCEILLAAPLSDKKVGLFQITILDIHPDIVETTCVSRRIDVGTIGSTKVAARTLLSIAERKLGKISEGKISCELAKLICFYILQLVIAKDALSNDYYNGAEIDENGARPIFSDKFAPPGKHILAQILSKAATENPQAKQQIERILRDTGFRL